MILGGAEWHRFFDLAAQRLKKARMRRKILKSYEFGHIQLIIRAYAQNCKFAGRSVEG